MPVLSEGQRGRLEGVVLTAREVAEAGARAAVRQLAVHAPEPFAGMSPADRVLRNRLRARARQLGDSRNAKTGEHAIEHLVVECAYEHWHRMLFARFLAENNVLMHPDGVAVTLQECEELAEDEGAGDGWELAARYAAKMLPQIFRPSSPVFEFKLPPERLRQLEQLLADLPPEVFTASDSLGWVYQFWQAKKKDQVNASEVKIGADELPAVTQLFTEPYMVQFLLQNTLGAWWVGRHGRDSLPVEMPYLRLLKDGTPATGTFDGWPKTASELKILDPCCGSGHFLVAAFEILVRFRMSEDCVTATAACDAVLRANLYGLEIDERCTQIAAFALALAAWTFPDSGGYRALPVMRVACSGLAPRATREEWLALAGEDERLRAGMERLNQLFKDAAVLGSLIDPLTIGMSGNQLQLGVALYEDIMRLLDSRIEDEAVRVDASRYERGIAAKGIVAAARLLAGRYTLIATNVPYLARGKQNPLLRAFSEEEYPAEKQDLATTFMGRCWSLLQVAGVLAAVTPKNWLHQSRYRAFRERLVAGGRIEFLVGLGAGAFDAITGEVVQPVLIVSAGEDGPQLRQCLVCDVSAAKAPAEKASALTQCQISALDVGEILKDPSRQLRTVSTEIVGVEIKTLADCGTGIQSFDRPRFFAFFWELMSLRGGWKLAQSTVTETSRFGGCEWAFRWEDGRGALWRLMESKKALEGYTSGIWRAGSQFWGKQGVLISLMGDVPASLYLGVPFDQNCAPIVPENGSLLPALWLFCASDEFAGALRSVDPSLKVTPSSLGRIRLQLEHWIHQAELKYPNGLPAPHSVDPTQWLFKGKIRGASQPLQVAVSRLLGYRWPDQAQSPADSLVDDDGIVCLPAVRGEQPATVRLQNVLASGFSEDWSTHSQAKLLADLGCKGWALERWLSERFFQQHCQLFKHRPFIWHIWDGLKKGGFSALVNYHKLDQRRLETLAYTYLGDWIRRHQDGAKRGEDGADDRLLAARALQEKLKLILEGEPPCDIFVRWKPIEQQPLGWEPDVNDGVRINIRPFMLVGDVGKKGAGVLRDKPNIKWGKDRGRDPADAPWFDVFGGDRINDHHLTLAAKRAARDGSGGG